MKSCTDESAWRMREVCMHGSICTSIRKYSNSLSGVSMCAVAGFDAHLVEDVGHQRVALQAAHLVVDRLDDIAPVGGVVAGAQGGLQVAHRVAGRLVGRRLDQCVAPEMPIVWMSAKAS